VAKEIGSDTISISSRKEVEFWTWWIISVILALRRLRQED
jgi:hypothetical protein